MNENFKKVATAVKGIIGKSNTLWGSLVAFVAESNANGADALKQHFKDQEALADVEYKMSMSKNSTYKVAKSVLQRATELGIAILTPEGKPRGKTDIEKDIADQRTQKSPADKFKAALAVAAKAADQLTEAEMPVSAAMVSELYKKLADRIPMLKAA